MLLVWALGCSSPMDAMLVYARGADGSHRVEPVALGVVQDPTQMITELGPARRGGYATLSGEVASFQPGGPVRVRHVVQDGVFVPQDEQGLVFASFFHHLGEVGDTFGVLGFDESVAATLPVDAVAFNPTLGSDLISFENAAYAQTHDFRGFVLFPDGNRDVPLGAHAGVVRHEFAHAFVAQHIPMFRLENQRDGERIVGQTALRAVNEGFADIVAVLTLDDPAALPIDGRDAAVFRDASMFVESDPYSVGVVLASFAWRLRQEVGSADGTLLLMIEALEQWDAEGWANGLTTPERFAEWMAATVVEAHPDGLDVVCDELALRFAGRIAACT